LEPFFIHFFVLAISGAIGSCSQMDARTTLAVIDHNLSQNRGQQIDAQGQGVYKTAYSKGTGKWVAKPVYNQKFYKWV
jgi:hypothetical protein